jgi:hypothetical protein
MGGVMMPGPQFPDPRRIAVGSPSAGYSFGLDLERGEPL